MMTKLQIPDLLDTGHTLLTELFDGLTYPWEALPKIKDFIYAIGETLDPDEYANPSPGVWISRRAKVFPSAYIDAPCIIDHDAQIRHCAFIRGAAVVGKGAVVGNSTELKNCVLFDEAQVPHFNYVGDSILGYKSHMGAGAITSNVRSDKQPVRVRYLDQYIETGLRKFGAILGDYADVGCNAVLCPGSVLGRRVTVYPTALVRGVVMEDHIVKSEKNIVRRLSDGEGGVN